MPLTCAVCDDPRLGDIEAALGDGATHADVARTFGLSRHALGRHVRGRHGPDAAVIAVASPKALASKDLGRRAHALLALADAEVRAAERGGSMTARLRSLRGYRRALTQTIGGGRLGRRADHAPASEVHRAELERSWLRAVAAFEAAAGRWPARLQALEGLREALAELYRANPPPGAQEVTWGWSEDGGETVQLFSFWSSDPRIIAARGVIQLELAEPGFGRQEGPE